MLPIYFFGFLDFLFGHHFTWSFRNRLKLRNLQYSSTDKINNKKVQVQQSYFAFNKDMKETSNAECLNQTLIYYTD